jgi:hypothetical protein
MVGREREELTEALGSMPMGKQEKKKVQNAEDKRKAVADMGKGGSYLHHWMCRVWLKLVALKII